MLCLQQLKTASFRNHLLFEADNALLFVNIKVSHTFPKAFEQQRYTAASYVELYFVWRV